jgi:dCTP deaminase
MPRNWAAYGFPPSHISGQGLLMTNPGHIDPGFSGRLRFTVINMSAEPISLRRGDPIVTLLIHSLEVPAAYDFRVRRAAAGFGPLPDPSWDDVNRLAKDFVDVESRSQKIASIEVKTAQEKLNRIDNRTKFLTAVAAILGVIGTLLVGWLTGLQNVKNDVSDLKSKIAVVELKSQITDLTARVAALESKQSEKKR